MIADEDREIVDAFLQESGENLDQLDRDLVALENAPGDDELLARVFRTVHTIKGTCGFLGFGALERLTHAGENLLGALRAGELTFDAEIAGVLLRLVDEIRVLLARIESGGDEGAVDHGELLAALTAITARRTDAGTVVHVTDEHRPRTTPDTSAPVTVPDPAPQATPPAHPPTPPAPAASTTDHSGHAHADAAIRVDVAVLDKLMDLVGELVLTRGRIGELAAQDEDGPLTAPFRALRLLTSELQDGVMRARLQPVGTVTGKFPRIARDVAAGLGKQVVVELEGEDVGVDKAINEALRDPLLHLVRNAVDHGIETPEERERAGKPPTGTLRIKAYHDRGRIHLDVSDDGRGIDPHRLVAKAVAAGLIGADDGARMNKHDALELVFRPGLSTKDEITNLSGRGVGMDVVRANLQQIGGDIEISSIAGVGSVFRIDVPLTLAIMPTLVVLCGGERYVLPQANVREIVRVEPGSGDTARTYEVDGTLVHRLRDELLPVVDLAHRLGLRDRPTTRHDDLHLVVLDCDDRRYALAVDGIGDTAEAVVKPATAATRGIAEYAGVTILSDGRAALILDVAGLANAAGLTATSTAVDATAAQSGAARGTNLLLARRDGATRVAVRLADVRRLERFPRSALERVGDREVVRYGDGVLTLVRLDADTSPDAPEFDVVVCAAGDGGDIGLVVDRIEDIVAGPATHDGADGALVVDGDVVELVDLAAAVGRP